MAVDLLLTVPVPSLVTRDPPLIPDLGLGYLAAHARAAGADVAVVDWNPRLTEMEYRAVLARHAPRVVGIKVFTVNVVAVLRTLRLIRETVPDAVVIVGGPHPTTAPPRYLFDEFPEADLAFRGEGESSLPRLLDALETVGGDRRRLGELGPAFAAIPGVVWRDGDADGGVRANANVFEDVRAVGRPAWDLIDPNRSVHFPLDAEAARRNPHPAPLLATRGCPFDCTFCAAHHVNSHEARRRDVDEFVDEIDHLSHRFGTTQFVVTDSSFMLDRAWVRRVCEEILRRGLDVRWECIYEVQGRIDLEGVEELFALMYRSGCRKLGFSPETAAPRLIRLIRKNFDPEALRAIHAMARRHGMSTMGFFMIGLPTETADEADETIAYALSEPYDQRFFNILIPLPGTQVYADLQRRVGFNRIDWARYRFAKPPYQLGRVPVPVLGRKIIKANLLAHLDEARGLAKVASPRPWELAAKYAVRRALSW